MIRYQKKRFREVVSTAALALALGLCPAMADEPIIDVKPDGDGDVGGGGRGQVAVAAMIETLNKEYAENRCVSSSTFQEADALFLSLGRMTLRSILHSAYPICEESGRFSG